MQTIQTTTDTTEAQATLTHLIAAYRAKKAHEAMLAGLNAAAINGEIFETFQQGVTNALPAELLAALDLDFRWIGDPFSRYDSRPQAAFTYQGYEWTIDLFSDWDIHGPDLHWGNIYTRDLADELMRALAAYEEKAPYLPEPVQFNSDMTSDNVPF
jgi:hypothetical protein